MQYVQNEVNTICVGIAYGHACMLLAAGTKTKRSMLPNATAMLHQAKVPPTGRRQAIEVEKKWREVAAQRDDFLQILSRVTGKTENKLWFDVQRPLYMQPNDALEYGIVDQITRSRIDETLSLKKVSRRHEIGKKLTMP